MRGKVLKSRDGKDFFSFTKIPYAKPPLGERRFKISEKADNWNGTLDATQHIPSCYQNSEFVGKGTSGQEDCLYLNVFTPNITGKLPVIFHVHGGAFKVGNAGGFDIANFFIDENIVFVATNYRLGTLGFLSLEDDVIPGNMGLKDQALALEWVRKEISAFGGDPDLITVMGESAGAASSHILCEIPRTRDLVKGCVSQSGDGWSQWAIMSKGHAREMALNLIKEVGCNETNTLQCLQSKPIELVGNDSLLINASQPQSTSRLTLSSPVLEQLNNPEAILTSWPTGSKHDYPRILGVSQDDGMIYTFLYEYHLKSQQEIDSFINNFNQSVISVLHLENRTNDFLKIRDRFFKKDVDPILAIRNFATEYLFVQPVLKSLSVHTGPIYFYKFNYTRGPALPFNLKPDHPGVPHGAEAPYLLGDSSHISSSWPNKEDVKLSKLLVKMWANFAKNQTPSGPGVVEWSKFQGQYFLDIQDSGVNIGNYTQYHEILDFWKTIFPEVPSSSSTIHSSLLLSTAFCIYTVFKRIFP
nr:venom carboxylesterase-6 [Arma chinensis]